MDFFRGLLDSDTFMPHGQCFLWYPEVLWLHVVSDMVITLAYFSIPASILYLIYKKGRVPFKWVYGMFGAFIFLCGLTHLIGVWVLWIPVYRLEGVVKAMTAGVSIATAFLIIPMIPEILNFLEKRVSAEKKGSSDNEQ